MPYTEIPHRRLFAASLLFFWMVTLQGLDLAAQTHAAVSPCLTPSLRSRFIHHVTSMKDTTEQRGKNLRESQPPRFVIPIDCRDNNDCYAVTNFVDHDSGFPDQVRDYQGGTRSYDLDNGYNHSGTDFLLWPFPWQQMTDDSAAVVAAASGTIIAKQDGETDRNCDSPSVDARWNAIAVQHLDGSTAIYGHFKRGSLTDKKVGDWVRQGEFLGVPGSSGFSTAPHLHFEVVDPQGNVIDPFVGDANPTTHRTWWQQQPAYFDAKLLRLMTHFDPPKVGCPQREVVNELDYFQPGMTAFVGAYLRDQRNADVLDFRVIQPDGSLFQSWDFQQSLDHLSVSFWFWNVHLPVDAPTGIWQVEVDYRGETFLDHFSVGNLDAPEPVSLAVSAETVTPGEPVTLQWRFDNATVVTLADDPRRFAPNDTVTLHPLATQTQTLIAEGPGGAVRVPVPMTVREESPRFIAHITRPLAGFTTNIAVFNNSDQPQTAQLQPYLADGQALPAFTLTVPAGVTLHYDRSELFGDEAVGHCRLSAPASLVFTTAYAAADNGSPAFVAESRILAQQWRLFPGDWAQVWDGLAVVNPHPESVQVDIEWVRADGEVIGTWRPQTLADLPANGKGLFVLEALDFRPEPGDAVIVRATLPVALLALRGDRDGSRFLWQNLAHAE